MTGKKYFPNNWQRYKNAPDSMFHQHTFEEIMNFKINGWELHDNVACIIREQNTRTGKVKEHVYQLQKAATRRVSKLMDQEDTEFTVCTPESIYFVHDGEDDWMEDIGE
jgi:hypothetical protein